VTVRSPTIAAIDLGTNTALLLVARRGDGGALETLEELCVTPRLGSGLARTGSLDASAMERALDALRHFARTIERHGVDARRVRAVGTACLRRARDGADFAQRVQRETGLTLEIVSESEEARLGELAIELAGAGADALVVDVGGGSTEIACRELGLRQSIPIGAVVLTETWIESARDLAAGWKGLRAAVREVVAAFPSGVAIGRAAWAIGGTAVNLGNLHAGRTRFDPRAVEGLAVPAARALEFGELLGPLTHAERLAFPVEPDRADILPAGLVVLGTVLEHLGARTVSVSGFGLRHGLARELLDG